VSLHAHESTYDPIERRSGRQRRRSEPFELVDVFQPEDRRLGLGRRWEDWCHPSSHVLESEGVEDELR
jgi:hypothetical protein